MTWAAEEKEAYYKKRNKQQRRVIYLVLIIPVLIGMFGAATGWWFVWPIVLISGIFYAIYVYGGVKTIALVLLYLLLMLIIIIAG